MSKDNDREQARRRVDARRARAVRHTRRESEYARDIGELPRVRQPARRKKALGDFLHFNRAYFPERFTLPFSDDHIAVIRRMEKVIWNAESYALAMARGTGKTSLCETATLFAILGGWHAFVCLVGSDKDAAVEMLESIKVELETNDRLLADFPEVVYPIRCLEGISNRARGQLYRGRRTAIKWEAETLVFPTIEGSIASGSTVRCRGITGRIRGMQRTLRDGRKIRPSLAIVDDPQTEESANSDAQCAFREKVVKRAIRGLAGPGKTTAVVVPCTVIRDGDLAARLLDRDRNPEFHGERFKLLKSFPANMELWDGPYDERRRAGLRADEGIAKATNFYKRNRKAMRDGAVAAWKQRKDDDELDAIQHALNLYLEDREAFAAERQNSPEEIRDQVDDTLDADAILAKVNGYGIGVAPDACEHVVAYIDVQARMLFFVVAAFADDFTGGILDYGGWPEQTTRYYSYRAARRTLATQYKGAGVESRIFRGLDDLVGKIAAAEWPRADGTLLRAERILVDSRYQGKTVFSFCRQSNHAAVLLPAQGLYIGARTRPISEDKAKRGELVGPFWKLRPDPATRQRKLLIDANVAKSFLHARLAEPDGAAGALRLYGRIGKRRLAANYHQLIADQIGGSETPTRTAGAGRQLIEWVHKPHKPDNHLFDAAAGVCAAASLCGCRLKTDPAIARPKRRRLAVTF